MSPPARGRSSSTRRRPSSSVTPSPRAPTRHSRTSRGGPATPPRGARGPAREAEEVLVLSGDVPLVKGELLAALLEARALDHAAMSLVAVDALDPTGLGRVVRNEGGTVERIVEDKDATDEERQITEINAGLYALDASWLRRRIGDLKPSPRPASCTSPTSWRWPARMAGWSPRSRSRTTGGSPASTTAPACPCRVGHAGGAQRPLDEGGRDDGRPVTVYLDHAVQLAEDVILEPGVVLRGATNVGDRTRIATGSQLTTRHRRALRHLGEHPRALDRGGRRHDRPVLAPPAGRPCREPLGDRQLRGDQEQPVGSTSASTT